MSMTDAEIKEAIAHFPSWEKNIRLSDRVSTNPEAQPQARANYVLQLVSRFFSGKLAGLRIVDLGCNEAEIAIEFAAQGASVMAVDGRETNLTKPRLVKEILGLDNLEIVKENVMDFRLEKYGRFDVVLCFGLLYHLDDPYTFLQSMAQMTKAYLFLNTHVAVPEKRQPQLREKHLTGFVFGGEKYWGKYFREHDEAPDQKRLKNTPRGSVHNLRSVWLTKHSLVSMLENVGFDYVLDDIRWNRVISIFDDTVLFICHKMSHTVQPRTCPDILTSFHEVRPMCTNTVNYLSEEEDKFKTAVKPFGYETWREENARKLKEVFRRVASLIGLICNKIRKK